MIDAIGKWIKYQRRKQGISRKILCRGLCTEDRLRRLEEDEQHGEKLFMDALVQRLGKSITKYDLILADNEYNLLLHRVRIQKKLRQAGKKTDILHIAGQEIQSYEKKLETATNLQRQFICLQKAEILRRLGADWQTQWDTICKGLQQTIDAPFWDNSSGFSFALLRLPSLNDCCFSMLEMLLLERYAILLEEKNTTEAMLWYRYLAGYISQKRQDSAEICVHYPFLAYHMAESHHKTGHPDIALKLTEKALAMLADSKMQSPLFVRCFELKQKILKEQNKYAEIPPRFKMEERCLDVFYEIMAEQREIWQENDYPIYTEVYVHSLSGTIRERRQLLGLTQKQLAEGICDAGTLSRIERGAHSPQPRTKEMLLKKLNITVLKYDERNVTRGYTDDRQTAALRHNDQTAKLWQLLEDCVGDRTQLTAYCYLPVGNERMHFHDAVWNNRTDSPQLLYDISKKQYETMRGTELEIIFSEHYITLLYCLGSNAWTLGKSEEALIYTEELQQKISYIAGEARLGAFLFLKARILKESKKQDACIKALRQSYAVELLLSGHEKAPQYIEAYIQEHFPWLSDDLLAPEKNK